MKKSNAFNEAEFFKVVGSNCRSVREMNGYTRHDVMQKVWAYNNKQQFNNRVSELENGSKKIDVATLYRFCVEMNCSADFILGLSNEVETDNLEAKMSGRLYQSLRSSVLEATDEICQSLSKSIRYLPPYQGELLKTSAQAVINQVERLSHDLAFRGQHADFIDSVMELKNHVIAFDRYTSRQIRQMEMSMMNLIDSEDGKHNGRMLNKSFVDVKSEKVAVDD